MKNISVNPSEYGTKDLHFAAFLQVKGVLITRLEQASRNSRGQKAIYFIFEDRGRCERLEDAFWNGVGEDVMVNAKDYFSAIRDLRARIFSITKPNKVVKDGEE